MIATLHFLASNGYWLETAEDDFEITAIFISNSEARCSNAVIEYLKCYFEQRITDFE